VLRDHCTRYESILAVAQSNFRDLQGVPIENIVLLSVVPDYPDQGQVELSKEIWPTVSAIVHSVTIALESEMSTSNECRCDSPDLPDYKESGVGNGAASSAPPPAVPTLPPPPPPRPYLVAPPQSQSVVPQQSSNATRTGFFRTRSAAVRKPVIYLYPPSSLPDVTVALLLAPSWSFSAVYPPSQTATPSDEHQSAQSLTWGVAAEPSGTLVDKTSGAEVSYLYWEATANIHPATPNASRPTTPIGDMETFDPSRPSVSPGDSVLLPIGKVPGYLDAALKALALHTEARTSFITYWLPDLLKHEYVALRFLTQASYEQAAQMHVSPAPDVVTRVFMLFRGVAADDLRHWEQAATRATAEDGATFWVNVVGVDLVRASDRGLFRVLEWGGMEVK